MICPICAPEPATVWGTMNGVDVLIVRGCVCRCGAVVLVHDIKIHVRLFKIQDRPQDPRSKIRCDIMLCKEPCHTESGKHRTSNICMRYLGT